MNELKLGKDILLFYVKHKWDYVDTYSQRTISGFYSWYSLLVRSLKESDYAVHENNFELAKTNPNYPIGLVGTPICINEWTLPNPTVLGPSMYDHPSLNPNLMTDSRFKKYLLTCNWLKVVFEEFYGNTCELWNAGISLNEWTDTANANKPIDVLIYDKIRWEKETISPLFIEPITDLLKKKNLSFTILPYGNITHEAYKDLLNKSKSMIFLCEHETQGMAYQEALASNIPILAWDYGWWTHPVWTVYSEHPIKATSVPYFSNECGEKFKMLSDFPNVFEKFWSNLKNYKPRQFIKEHLSFQKSADCYAKIYFNI